MEGKATHRGPCTCIDPACLLGNHYASVASAAQKCLLAESLARIDGALAE